MPTNLHRPALDPTAKLLRAALAAKGVRQMDLARRLGRSLGCVSNWCRGTSAVSPEAAQEVGKILGVPWEPLVSEPGRGRPVDRRSEPGPAAPAGPASRALALHERPPAPLQLARPALAPAPAPRPSPVLAFELWSDGTATIALKTQLPADRGGVLLRQLLDFGLTATKA